jgi:hypothetical protein
MARPRSRAIMCSEIFVVYFTGGIGKTEFAYPNVLSVSLKLEATSKIPSFVIRPNENWT